MITTMKLTDTHRAILSQAAQRPALRVLPTPTGLKARGGAIVQILKGLLRRGLIVEQPARGGDAVWRHDDAGLPLTLVLAPDEVAAIGLDPHHDEAEPPRTERVESRTEEVKAAPLLHPPRRSAPLNRAGAQEPKPQPSWRWSSAMPARAWRS